MDRYGLKPGARGRTPDSTVAEILTETQDGHWIRECNSTHPVTVPATGRALLRAISAESLISPACHPSQAEVPLAAHQRGMWRMSR